MGENTVTISTDEYAELIGARVRMNILVAWVCNHKYISEDDVKHLLGIWKEEAK